MLLSDTWPCDNVSRLCCHMQGISGTRPSSSELISALQHHELFLYFGHGGGEQYVPLAALKRLDRCAGSLLMGCSSGRLKQAGLYEPSGAIWGYLMAGDETGFYSMSLWPTCYRGCGGIKQQRVL